MKKTKAESYVGKYCRYIANEQTGYSIVIGRILEQQKNTFLIHGKEVMNGGNSKKLIEQGRVHLNVTESDILFFEK